MDDKELLERAAKAAGYGELRILDDSSIIVNSRRWNPLADDGDALRLAVKLGIDISFMLANAVAQTITGIGEHDTVVETHEQIYPDSCAATRRAIVRAAAEIWTKRALPLAG